MRHPAVTCRAAQSQHTLDPMTEEASIQEIELPRLVTLGDARLARPCPPVAVAEIAGASFQAQLEVLAACMDAYLGIGIAGPQIGWFERVFLMTVEPPGEKEEGMSEAAEQQFWINPEVVWQSEAQAWAWEGCLSVPGLRGWIRRPLAVTARGLEQNGEPVSREFTGWNARLFQHEFDHLEGMLFPYRVADPRHLVTLEALEQREHWPPGWPAPGAGETEIGVVLPENDG